MTKRYFRDSPLPLRKDDLVLLGLILLLLGEESDDTELLLLLGVLFASGNPRIESLFSGKFL